MKKIKITPFEQFILINLYNLWKEHGTSKVKTFEALIEEYEFKEKNIRKPLKKLISAGLVDSDSYSAWITKNGIRQMQAALPPDDSTVNQENKTSVKIEIRFIKNFEQAISKSELIEPEKQMWLSGINQMSQNPVLLKAVEEALNATIEKNKDA
ncbi:MAG: hypothetical protein GY777_22860 [Candidatus Brocadiaceae bacterium]|nr:hypothetical protein [Candidatus Brocadiaceae bacterium]